MCVALVICRLFLVLYGVELKASATDAYINKETITKGSKGKPWHLMRPAQISNENA